METEVPQPQETVEADRQEEAQNLKREIIDFVKLGWRMKAKNVYGPEACIGFSFVLQVYR